jgi:hypothetical protein
MAFENTQLTSALGYDVNRMIFGKAKDGSIPNSTVAFKRIAIGTRNQDGTLGELVIPTSRVYSFGLSPNTNMQTGKTDGYTLSLCLFNRDSPSAEEKAWVDTFNKIVDHIKDYLIENRDSFGKYELEAADLKKLSPLYYKRDKGKIVEGTGPVLYPKVLQNKKTETITTFFCDEQGRDIDPMSLLNKSCYATAAVKIESIFIGAKISLQIKVHEAEVKMFDSAPKRLLRKPVSSSAVIMEDTSSSGISSSAFERNEVEDVPEDDDGSVKGSDDDEEEVAAVAAPVPTPAPAPAKAAVRRVVRKA